MTLAPGRASFEDCNNKSFDAEALALFGSKWPKDRGIVSITRKSLDRMVYDMGWSDAQIAGFYKYCHNHLFIDIEIKLADIDYLCRILLAQKMFLALKEVLHQDQKDLHEVTRMAFHSAIDREQNPLTLPIKAQQIVVDSQAEWMTFFLGRIDIDPRTKDYKLLLLETRRSSPAADEDEFRAFIGTDKELLPIALQQPLQVLPQASFYGKPNWPNGAYAAPAMKRYFLDTAFGQALLTPSSEVDTGVLVDQNYASSASQKLAFLVPKFQAKRQLSFKPINSENEFLFSHGTLTGCIREITLLPHEKFSSEIDSWRRVRDVSQAACLQTEEVFESDDNSDFDVIV